MKINQFIKNFLKKLSDLAKGKVFFIFGSIVFVAIIYSSILYNSHIKQKRSESIRAFLDNNQTVFMSFYWNFNINGEYPDYQDSIKLEFMSSENNWELVWYKTGGAENFEGNNFIFEDTNIYITRSGYTGEDGFEISIENKFVELFVEELLKLGAKLIGLGARDTLRLEAGLCLYGNDIDVDTTPIEANLKWAISKNRIDTDYPGSKIIKKQIQSGVEKIRVGIKPENRVIARGNTKIFNNDDKEIGKITSGTFGPSVDHSIAMGYVDNQYSDLNTKLFLEVRGKKIPANICNLPFYKKNYVKGEINV